MSIVLIYLLPYVIKPLFFKFRPVTTPGLEEKIRELMARAGLQVGSVMQMDASRHSNAYFTGIGLVKRIVLYDTLLERMSNEEVLAVLAHEVGHWKQGHVWKRVVKMETAALVALHVAFQLLLWGGLPGVIGLPQASFPAQVAVLAFIVSIASFPLAPVSSWLSRRHEWQADRFAAELTGVPHHMANALRKLLSENLANLHPHPLYASFYYSHPPVVDRVRKLLETR